VFVAALADTELPIRGNTHFPFSGTNNIEIANLLSKSVAHNQLDPGAREIACLRAQAVSRFRGESHGNHSPTTRYTK
jgi:hypothetical protein